MPADKRMSLNSILSQNATGASLQTKRSRPAIRPPFLQSRVHSSSLSDPWEYHHPHFTRSESSYSVYSATSASSIDSNSLPVPITSNPGLERSESSDSCKSGPISPTTPIDPLDAAQPMPIITASTRPEDLAAGVALTSLSKQSPYSRPAPPTFVTMPYMPAPPSGQTSPVTTTSSSSSIASQQQPPRRSSSPRAPRDANGNRLYPCPLASTYHCQQHFSTSGHARRHSRIHTGERGAECPECGQRFSRQDNMQQHRRTHRNGRDGRRAAAAAAAAVAAAASSTGAAGAGLHGTASALKVSPLGSA